MLITPLKPIPIAKIGPDKNVRYRDVSAEFATLHRLVDLLMLIDSHSLMRTTRAMQLFIFLVLILADQLGHAHSSGANTPVTTFVIVHGATGGGWDWRGVSEQLSQQGHTVYRPTLTGLGERFHLASEAVTLDTHIADIVNLIQFEKLQDVILVGHSYGGMVITGVMNAIPERIQHATFLDAAVPDHGMSAIETWGGKFTEYPIENGLVKFSWVDPSQPLPRDVYHPANTINQAVNYNNPLAMQIPVTYVAFIPEGMSRTARARDPSWQRAEARGWRMRTFSGDHVIYREKPAEMATLLVDALSDENTDIK